VRKNRVEMGSTGELGGNGRRRGRSGAKHQPVRTQKALVKFVFTGVGRLTRTSVGQNASEGKRKGDTAAEKKSSQKITERTARGRDRTMQLTEWRESRRHQKEEGQTWGAAGEGGTTTGRLKESRSSKRRSIGVAPRNCECQRRKESGRSGELR